MYLDFYHLSAMPFQLTPDSQFFFESHEHRRAIAHLVYGLAQEEGFIVITGEIGAGKTMLVERLWSQLNDDNFLGIRISTTQISGDDLLRIIAHRFDVPAEGADKATLLHRLEKFFGGVHASGKRCLLVIDEVQNLPLIALEELRMLSNITIDGRAPFQCLLLGQPQFRETLADPRLEQVRQRVLASYHLGPLSEPETKEYILHRLRTAGWSGDPSFEDQAFTALHHSSSGIPRRINILCSRTLLAGFLDDTHNITEAMVNDVAGELQQDLTAGVRYSQKTPSSNEAYDRNIDWRLMSIEQTVARHDRVLKRTLEIAVELFEPTS
jgi:general secretion pathway protein A